MIIKNLLLFNAIIMENTKHYAMYLETDNKLVQNSNWEIYIFTDFEKCNKMCDLCYGGGYSSGHCIAVEITKKSPMSKYCLISL